MTSTDQGADRIRGPAVVLAALLLAAGVIAAVSPSFGMVHPADGAAVSAYAVAGWLTVLPGVLALGLAWARPMAGLAATAGAGLVGAARLLADLAVLTETDRVSRPELFVETTDRARPFGTGVGGWLLIAADLAMIVIGLLAARRLASELVRDGPGADALFGSPAPPPEGPPDGAAEAPAAVAAMADSPSERRRLNLPMLGVGFLGSVLLLVGNLDIPYTGGYLALRVLPFGSSVGGLAAAVVLAVTAAAAVLVAAALPREVAQALLGGTALAAAVPSLIAVAAVAFGTPTELSAGVWWALAGAAILAASGLLTRPDPVRAGPPAEVARPGPPTLTAAICALAAASALAGASQMSLLYLDGAPPDDVAGGLLRPAASPLLVAAIPLAIAAVLTLLPDTVRAGRAALMVTWAGAAYALGRAFWATSLVGATSAGSASGVTHTWTIGPGGALMALGAALAVAAALLAAVGHRRAVDASPDVVDDDSLTSSRERRRWIAVALTVAIPVALALPVYTGPGVSSAPGLFHGLDLDTWAFWALAGGGWFGLWLGAWSRYPQMAAAGPIGAAAVLAQPLAVPGVVRELPGFSLTAGFWAILVVSVMLVAVAVMFTRSAATIDTRQSWVGGAPPARSRVGAESKGGER